VFVLLIAGQLLIGRQHFWLPQWLLERTVSAQTLRKAIGWVRRPARTIDAVIKPRLAWLTHNAGKLAAAATCAAIALATPFMEIVLFSANVAGAALAAFGAALVAHDGVLALLAYLATALAALGIAYTLL
jgi:hypothetical protein